MTRRTTTYTTLMLLAALTGTQAQNKLPNDTTLNRTVVVEQEYTPHIQDAAKINIMPEIQEPTVDKKDVVYDETTAPATQLPPEVMQPYALDEQPGTAPRGYARLGYGNYNNLDVRAAYRFDLSARDCLNLGVGIDGMSGTLEPDPATDWDAFDYHTRAHVDYRHRFDRATIDVAGRFGLRNFNLLPGLDAGKQKFTNGGVHLGSASTDSDMPLQYRVETNLDIFNRQHDILGDDNRQTRIRTKADVWGDINERQLVGIAAEMNNLIYSGSPLLQNYTALNLAPYFRFKPGRWDVRLGVNIDFSFGYGKQFRISPDVRARLRIADNQVFYINATGGKRLNDYQRLAEVNPYVLMPAQLDATYETLNAALGYKANPVDGFWLNVYAGYRNLQNDLFFSGGNPALTHRPVYDLQPYLSDIQNLNAGLDLSYDYRGLLAIAASVQYRHWFSQYRANIATDARPALVGQVRADIHPLEPLELTIGFRFASKAEDISGSLGEYNDLYLRGSYEFIQGVAIYVQAQNLTNSKNLQRYWWYPTRGINFLGGLSFRF